MDQVVKRASWPVSQAHERSGPPQKRLESQRSRQERQNEVQIARLIGEAKALAVP